MTANAPLFDHERDAAAFERMSDAELRLSRTTLLPELARFHADRAACLRYDAVIAYEKAGFSVSDQDIGGPLDVFCMGSTRTFFCRPKPPAARRLPEWPVFE